MTGLSIGNMKIIHFSLMNMMNNCCFGLIGKLGRQDGIECLSARRENVRDMCMSVCLTSIKEYLGTIRKPCH